MKTSNIVLAVLGLCFTLTAPALAFDASFEPSSIGGIAQSGDYIIQYNLTIANLEYPIWAVPVVYLPNFEFSHNPSGSYPISQNGTYTNQLTLHIPSNYPAGTYYGNITYWINYTEHQIPIEVEVPVLSEFEIYNTTLAVNTTSGASGSFVIDVYNKGNIDLFLHFNCSRFCSNQEYEFLIYRNRHDSIPIYYRIPDNVSGEQQLELDILNYSVLVNFTAVDTQKPIIKNIDKPEKHEILKPFTLKVDAEDNIRISQINATVCEQNKRLLFDYGIWQNDFTANKTGDCDITIEATDESGNKAKKETYLEITPQEDTWIEEDIQMPKLKRQQEYEYHFLQLADMTTYSVSLDSIEFEGNYSSRINQSDIVVRLRTSQGTTTLKTGETYSITSAGKVYLVVTGLDIFEYRLFLNFVFPSGIFSKQNYNVIASGEISDYFVQKDYSGKIGGLDAECHAFDKGNYYDSYYECTFRYDIDVELDKLTVPRTQEDIDNLKRGLELQAASEKERADFNGAGWFWTFVLFTIAIVAYFIKTRMLDKAVLG